MRITIGNDIIVDTADEEDPVSIEFTEQELINFLKYIVENSQVRDFAVIPDRFLENNTKADIILWMSGGGDLN